MNWEFEQQDKDQGLEQKAADIKQLDKVYEAKTAQLKKATEISIVYINNNS